MQARSRPAIAHAHVWQVGNGELDALQDGELLAGDASLLPALNSGGDHDIQVSLGESGGAGQSGGSDA